MQLGGTGANAAENIEGATIELNKDTKYLVEILKAGQVDAVVVDISVAENYKQWKIPTRIYINLKRLNDKLPYHFTDGQIYSIANSRLGWYKKGTGWVSSFLLNTIF